MYKSNRLIIAAICIIVQIVPACNKEPTPEVNTAANTAPKSLGGYDQLVFLPINSAVLDGRSFDEETPDKLLYEWRKIKGPETYNLENKNSLVAKLGNLGKGNYEFELTVTDPSGLSGKDTVAMQVVESAGELILNNVPWEKFYGAKPDVMRLIIRMPNLPFKAFVKAPEVTTWMSVITEMDYNSSNLPTNTVFYRLVDNSLFVESENGREISDWKIIF